MQSISGMLMKLNLATRRWHADVDDPWLELLRPDVTASEYLAQLVRTYGLIAPFESACKYTPGVAKLVDFRQLLRAGLIAQDILALGIAPNQVSSLPTCPAIIVFRDVAEAFGWLYVIERSTLLQDGVRRHLVNKIPKAADACAYLSAYEGHVSDHWLAFGRTLDRVSASHDAEGAIIASAEQAFEHARHWLASARGTSRSVG